MATKAQRSNFSVESFLPQSPAVLRKPLAATIDTVLALRKLADFYYGFPADMAPVEFARAVIAGLGVSLRSEPA
jgi:hypothetical protein